MLIKVTIPRTAGLLFRSTKFINVDVRFEDVSRSDEFVRFLEHLHSIDMSDLGFPFPRWQYLWRQWQEFYDAGREAINDKRSYYRNEYLKSDHWKNLKAQFFQTPRSCFVCKKSGKLDIHHRAYRNLYDVEESDLVALCRKCHTALHSEISPDAKGWIREVSTDFILRKMAGIPDAATGDDTPASSFTWRMSRPLKPVKIGRLFRKRKDPAPAKWKRPRQNRFYNYIQELERKERQGRLCVLKGKRLRLIPFRCISSPLAGIRTK